MGKLPPSRATAWAPSTLSKVQYILKVFSLGLSFQVHTPFLFCKLSTSPQSFDYSCPFLSAPLPTVFSASAIEHYSSWESYIMQIHLIIHIVSSLLSTISFTYFPPHDALHKFTPLSLNSKTFAPALDQWPCYLLSEDCRHLFWILSFTPTLLFSNFTLLLLTPQTIWGTEEHHEKANDRRCRGKNEEKGPLRGMLNTSTWYCLNL